MSSPIHIDQFKPPRRFNPAIVGIVAAVVALTIVLAARLLSPSQISVMPSVSPSTARSESAQPTTPAATKSTPSREPGINFKSPTGVEGHWNIEKTEWNGGTVMLLVTIRVDAGNLRTDILATDNTNGRYIDPVPLERSPRMLLSTIRAGETRTGWIAFDLKTRQDGTLLLADGKDAASALPIAG